MRAWAGVVLALLAVPAGAWGQELGPVVIERTSGFLRMEYEGQALDRSGAPGSQRHGFLERLQARLEGALYHPDFLAFDVGIEPYGRQTAYRSELAGDRSGRSESLNGYFNVRFLSERALTATVLGSRTNSWTHDTYGTETASDQDRLGGTLSYRNVLMPMALEYETVGSRIDWRLGDQPMDGRDFRTRKLELRGESSKTRLQLRRFSYDDPSRDMDLRETLARASHGFGWGKGSSLSSLLLHTDRTRNGSALRDTRWTQSARLQHTRRVGSTLTYALGRGEARRRSTSLVSTSATTSVLVTSSIETGVMGSYSRRGQAGTASTHARLGAQAGYRRQYTEDLSFNALVSAGSEWQTNRLKDGDWFEVVDEVYVVPEAGVFRLRAPHIDLWSIDVASADGTDSFREFQDFLLVRREPFVEFHDLPQGRIQPGDSVAISYRHRLQEGYRAGYGSFRADLSFRGLSVYHSRSLRGGEQQNLDGATPSLSSMDEMSTGLSYTVARGWGTVQGMLQHRRLRSDYGDFDQVMGRGQYRFEIGPRFGGSVGGSANRTYGEDVKSVSWGLGAGALYRATSTLDLNGSFNVARWRNRGMDGTNLGTGAGLSWVYGEVTVHARFDHYWWDNPVPDGTQSSSAGQDRLLVRMTRKF